MFLFGYIFYNSYVQFFSSLFVLLISIGLYIGSYYINNISFKEISFISKLMFITFSISIFVIGFLSWISVAFLPITAVVSIQSFLIINLIVGLIDLIIILLALKSYKKIKFKIFELIKKINVLKVCNIFNISIIILLCLYQILIMTFVDIGNNPNFTNTDVSILLYEVPYISPALYIILIVSYITIAVITLVFRKKGFIKYISLVTLFLLAAVQIIGVSLFFNNYITIPEVYIKYYLNDIYYEHTFFGYIIVLLLLIISIIISGIYKIIVKKKALQKNIS